MKPFHFLTITLLASAIFTAPVPAQNSASNETVVMPFADVPANHWAAPAVKRLAELGIIEGFPSQIPASAPVAKQAVPRVEKARATQKQSVAKSARVSKRAVVKSVAAR